MKTINIIFFIVSISFPAANISYADDKESNEEILVKEWLEEWGDKWWERYHRDLDARYPGGRSDHYHNIYVMERLEDLPENTASEWSVSNRRYIYDGKWFAVEWIYEATQSTTGRVQRESTLAFGKIEDDHLKIWVEYFDDMVGRYQWMGAMRLFGENEDPYPWPADTALSREYRP